MQHGDEESKPSLNENLEDQFASTGCYDEEVNSSANGLHVGICTSTPLRNCKAPRLQQFSPSVSPVMESPFHSAGDGDAGEKNAIDNVRTLANSQFNKLNLKKEVEEFKMENERLNNRVNELKLQVDEYSKEKGQLQENEKHLTEKLKRMGTDTVSKISHLKNILRQKDVDIQKLLSYTEELKQKIGVEREKLSAVNKQLHEQKQENNEVKETLRKEREAATLSHIREKDMEEELSIFKAEKKKYEEMNKANEAFSSKISQLHNEKNELKTQNQSLLELVNELSKEKADLRDRLKDLTDAVSKLEKEAEQNAEKEREFLQSKVNEKNAAAKLRELEGKLDVQIAENKKIRDQYEYFKQKEHSELQKKELKNVAVETKEKFDEVALLENQKWKDEIALLNHKLCKLSEENEALKSEKQYLDDKFQYYMKAANMQYLQDMFYKDSMIQVGKEEVNQLKGLFVRAIERTHETFDDSSLIVPAYERSLWDVIPDEVRSVIESLKENYRSLNVVVNAMKTAHVLIDDNTAEAKTCVHKNTQVSLQDTDNVGISLSTSLVSSNIGDSPYVSTMNSSREDTFNRFESCIMQVNVESNNELVRVICSHLLTLLADMKRFDEGSCGIMDSVKSFLNSVVHEAKKMYEITKDTNAKKSELVEINENLLEEFAKSQEIINHLKGVNEELQGSKKIQNEEICSLEERLSQMKNQLGEMAERNNDAAKIINEYDSELSIARELIPNLCEENKKLKNEILRLNSENESVKATMKKIERHLLAKYKEKCCSYEDMRKEIDGLKKKCGDQKDLLNEAIEVYNLTNKRIEHLIYENTIRQKKIDLCYNFLKVAGVEDSKLLNPLSRENGQATDKSCEERRAEVADIESALENVHLDVPSCAIEDVLEKLQ